MGVVSAIQQHTGATMRQQETDMIPQARFVVIYRMGGTANFVWRRSLEMSQAEAVAACNAGNVAGRAAFIALAPVSPSWAALPFEGPVAQ